MTLLCRRGANLPWFSGNLRLVDDPYLPPRHYPGSLDQSQAGVMEVAAGAQLQGYDLQIKKVRAFRVNGYYVDGDSLFVHLQPKTRHGFTHWVPLGDVIEEGGGY